MAVIAMPRDPGLPKGDGKQAAAARESARLAALRSYGILDTPPEQDFDDLVELAAAVCDVPTAAILFVDEARAWVKARRGTELVEMPRDASLGAEAICHDDVFVVGDIPSERTHSSGPVVEGGFRFFAGAPFLTREGHRLGAICVLDVRPRELSPVQVDALRAIARQVMTQLELRRVSNAEGLARRRFRTLMEQLPGATYIEDLGTSSASYMSPQIESLTGYTAGEWAAGDDFFARVLHPDDRDRVLAAFAAASEARGLLQIEYRLIAKDGGIVWIQDDAAVARDDDGRPLYLQGYLADVTRRKENELKLLDSERAQNERLRELDALKDEFVALISHELRTPLTSILGYLELALEDAETLPDQHRSYLGVVERNADRLLRLVGDLLFVAQLESGKLDLEWSEVVVETLVAQCVEANQPAARRAGILLAAESGSVGAIPGDPARLAQVVDNLISNAIKFTAAGGRVTIRTEQSAGAVVLEVEDTGMGIPVEEQQHLFDRFFRTRSAGEKAIPGTGLGLSIAQAIAQAHGGFISVASTEGVGTTFRVELPSAVSAPLASV